MCGSCLPGFICTCIGTIPERSWILALAAQPYLQTRVIHNSFFRQVCPARFPVISLLFFNQSNTACVGPHKNELWSGASNRTDHQPKCRTKLQPALPASGTYIGTSVSVCMYFKSSLLDRAHVIFSFLAECSLDKRRALNSSPLAASRQQKREQPFTSDHNVMVGRKLRDC